MGEPVVQVVMTTADKVALVFFSLFSLVSVFVLLRRQHKRNLHRRQTPPTTKGPGAGARASFAMEEEDAARHHVWFTANLREIHVNSLAVRDLGTVRCCRRIKVVEPSVGDAYETSV